MTKEHGLCQQAEMHYYTCLEQDVSDIPDEVLQHLNTCDHCAEQMARLSAVIKQVDSQAKPAVDVLPLHHRLMDQWVCCDHVKPFIPLLVMKGQTISVVTPVTAHVDRCPDCANDYQTFLGLGLSADQLKDASRFLAGQSVESFDNESETKTVLEAILMRPASSVATRTSVQPQADLAVDGDVPLEIEQAERLESSAKPHTRRHPVAKIISTAALLVLAAYILIQIQPASVEGLGIKDVYGALGKVTNVCIESIAPEEKEPFQTMCFSNSLQTVYSRTKHKTVLWDMKNRCHWVNGVLQPDSIPQKASTEIVQLPWGLLPFKNISELPENYEWTHIESIRQLAGKPVLVYDYTWHDGTADFYIHRKWRGYLDPKTKLPHRIEAWDKLPGQDFELITISIITYPTDEQIKAINDQSRSLATSP
jgi:hypothetical protein